MCFNLMVSAKVYSFHKIEMKSPQDLNRFLEFIKSEILGSSMKLHKITLGTRSRSLTLKNS